MLHPFRTKHPSIIEKKSVTKAPLKDDAKKDFSHAQKQPNLPENKT
jgi:hypothetical protein